MTYKGQHMQGSIENAIKLKREEGEKNVCTCARRKQKTTPRKTPSFWLRFFLSPPLPKTSLSLNLRVRIS